MGMLYLVRHGQASFGAADYDQLSELGARQCEALGRWFHPEFGAVPPFEFVRIAEDTGLIGMSWGVDWCVAGYDRNWAYNPGCKMARP